jgi:hypothetical protein
MQVDMIIRSGFGQMRIGGAPANSLGADNPLGRNRPFEPREAGVRFHPAWRERGRASSPP